MSLVSSDSYRVLIPVTLISPDGKGDKVSLTVDVNASSRFDAMQIVGGAISGAANVVALTARMDRMAAAMQRMAALIEAQSAKIADLEDELDAASIEE